MRRLRIAICGASGNLGRMLVPILARDADIVVVGRNRKKTAERFPSQQVFDNGQVRQAIAGCDLVLNLAALNNDSSETLKQFEAVNVEFMLDLARECEGSGVRRFVNFSTQHVLQDTNRSNYAASKRRAERELAAQTHLNALSLRLPATYGDEFSGRLSIIRKLPRLLQSSAFGIATAFKPALSVDRLAHFLLHEAVQWPDQVTELSDDQSSNAWFAATKRLIDICFALIVLALFWWLLLLIWLSVRLESPGPGIFAQRRVGRNAKEFTCYKFRTMAEDTKQAGTHEVAAANITRIGSVLRRTKLDELPQIFNLLSGELSLVGPRPCLPVQTKLVSERQRRGVLSVRPGITGLAQINDIDMSTPKLLSQWDRRYVMTRTIPTEIALIISTFLGRGQGDRVRS